MPASIVAISSVSGTGDRLRRRPLRHVQGGAGPLHPGVAYQQAAKGIRANTVSPGNTYFAGGVWEQIEHGNPDLYRHRAGAESHRPDGRAAGNGERRRVYLASPAASFISGTNLVVDGALTRGVQL